MAHDVFVSYASSDKAVADAVCSQLESLHRIRCWIAPRDVTPGASWAESIIDALDQSKIMVLIFSSNANASMQIEREVERAVHKGINIIPLRIENTVPTKTLEYFISAPHWLDALTVPLEIHIDKLAASVKALLARHGAGLPPRLAELAAAATPSAVSSSEMAERAESSKVAKRQRFVVPAVLVTLVVIGAIASRVGSRRSAIDPAATAAGLGATTEGSPPAAVAATEPASTAPAAAVPPASGSETPTVSTVKPTAAISANLGSVKGGNLLIEVSDNLPNEGSLKLDVDGVPKWTHTLDAKAKAGSLLLSNGAHQITVTLMNPKGEVKETRTTAVSADPGTVRALKVRLSRFRRNLELEVALARPKTDGRGTPPPAPAGGGRKTADTGARSSDAKAPATRP